MQITILKAKLHRACITHAELDYEGSCAIDGKFLELSGIHEYEQIQIYNISNEERFTTYAITAESGSKVISVNGAAAHKAKPGDRVIICSYGNVEQKDVDKYQPTLIYLDENNNIKNIKNHIPVQAA